MSRPEWETWEIILVFRSMLTSWAILIISTNYLYIAILLQFYLLNGHHANPTELMDPPSVKMVPESLFVPTISSRPSAVQSPPLPSHFLLPSVSATGSSQMDVTTGRSLSTNHHALFKSASLVRDDHADSVTPSVVTQMVTAAMIVARS